MWIQAATTMGTYQAVAGSAVASTPQTDPAPPILKAGSSTGLGTLLESLVQKLGVSDKIVDEFGIDNIYDFLNNPVSYTESHAIYRLLTDPLGVLENPLYLFYDGDEVFFPLGQAILPTASLPIAPVGSAGGLAGLAGLAGVTGLAGPPQLAVAPALAPVAAAPAVLPVAGMAPSAVASAVAPGTAPAPAPTASTVASSALSPSAPPAAGGAGFVPPYAVGPPVIGVGSRLSTSAGSSAKRKAPQPGTAAAAATAAREQARARRRRRAKQRGYGDEFADMDVEVDPDWGTPPGVGVPPAYGGEPVTSSVASDRGAGTLGFAGTVSKNSAQAAGLTTLSGDEFSGGPRIPMLPNTWNSEAPTGEPEDS